VQDLQRENKSIKEQSQKSENLNNNVPYSYELATEVLPVEDSVEYGPYKIKYKNNDITKISNRVGMMPQLRPEI